MANDPNAVIAVAHSMAAAGAPWEAEVTLHAALARTPGEHAYRSALMTLRTEKQPAGGEPLDFALALRWIRDGMLVEALALLVGFDMGEEAEHWSEVLGELLAPVPTRAPDHFHRMHEALLTGGASVALTVLEDASREGPLPSWADRRLKLLRWVLLDNAALATDEVGDTTHSELSRALTPGLEARDLEAMAEAAGRLAGATADASAAHDALRRLCAEVKTQALPDNPSNHTLPISGRTAAAMQLMMANLEVAEAMYEQLLAESGGDAQTQGLLSDVGGIVRVLAGNSFTHRRFAPPRAFEDSTVRLSSETARYDESAAAATQAAASFDDATAVRHISDVELATTFEGAMTFEGSATGAAHEPAQRGATFEGLGFDDTTRVAESNELPLAAFGEDITRAVTLPEAEAYSPPATSPYDDVTMPDAQVAKKMATFEPARIEPAGSAHETAVRPADSLGGAAPATPTATAPGQQSPAIGALTAQQDALPSSGPSAAAARAAPPSPLAGSARVKPEDDDAVRVMPIVPVGSR